MIKATGASGGVPLLVLGLARRNCERLLAGEPILIDTGELGDPDMVRLRVLVMGGQTEDDIAAALQAVAPAGQVQDLRE